MGDDERGELAWSGGWAGEMRRVEASWCRPAFSVRSTPPCGGQVRPGVIYRYLPELCIPGVMTGTDGGVCTKAPGRALTSLSLISCLAVKALGDGIR